MSDDTLQQPPSSFLEGHPERPLPPAPRPAARSRRGGFAAAVVTASLVVGGAGGYAAGSLSSSPSAAPPAATTTTTSSDTGSQAAPLVSDGSVESVAKAVLPSVVQIDVSGAQGSGSGSGIVLSSDGKILTNNHVVAIGNDLTVLFNDGGRAKAKVIGTDPLTDLAVIQAQGVSGLTPATIGRSGTLAVGQPVVAFGSPFGLASTVTSGIVSALDRPVDVGQVSQGNVTVYPAIQTDAAINPGNSGGALADMGGRVVGINASIQTATNGTGTGEPGSIGLGFAIPIDEAMPIVHQILAGQTPTHARLGVSVASASSSSPTDVGDGARLEQVDQNSAAAKAGLRAGDLITQVNDRVITNADALIATIRSYRPGDRVQVTYVRGGQTDTVTITLDSDQSSALS